MFEIKRYSSAADELVTVATAINLELAWAVLAVVLDAPNPPDPDTGMRAYAGTAFIVDAEGVDVREYAPECHETGTSSACECFCDSPASGCPCSDAFGDDVERMTDRVASAMHA